MTINKIFGVELLVPNDEGVEPPLQLATTKERQIQKQIAGLPNVLKRLNRIDFIMGDSSLYYCLISIGKR
jgi:hypothetical protein